MRPVSPPLFAKILLGIQLVALTVHAEDREPGSEGSAALGYVGTTGNTESQTFETQVRYVKRSEDWVHGLEFQGLYTEQESITSGERYFLQGKSDYRLGEDDYVFGKASYTDDRFTGFDYQATVSAGYGHYFYNRDDLLLETFVGLGYRYNAIPDAPGEGESMLSLGENLQWDFTDTTSMTQSLTSEIGEDLTVTKFEIGLISNLIGLLATKIAFQARHISEVPPERENTDTQTSVSLVYEF